MNLMTAGEMAVRLRRPPPREEHWTDSVVPEICIDMFAGAGGASCGIEAVPAGGRNGDEWAGLPKSVRGVR